ncbi:MAG: ABC transporter ATP-binding protein, partial [Acidimicrobiales bacterium]
ILADEPTGALDSQSAADIMTLLDELHGAGRTIVLITHDAEVASVAQRSIRLRDGLVVPAVELAS